MREQIRVLQVVGGLNRGGIETWLAHVLGNIDSRIHMDFAVDFDRPYDLRQQIESFGARVFACLAEQKKPSVPIWSSISLAKRYRRGLSRILQDYGPFDIVHCHRDPTGFPLGIAKDLGVPVRIAHSHNDCPEFAYRHKVVRLFMSPMAHNWIQKYATHGLAASRKAARAKFGYNWVNDPRWQVLYCGVDLQPFQQPCHDDNLRTELGIPRERMVVGHVGRFVRQKNHQFFLEIARELIKLEPNAHFLLVGDGPLRQETEAKIEQSGLQERVTLAGVRSDVPRLMRAAMDVQLFPSLFEGLGLVLVEAQASGLVSVLSDVIPEEADVVPSLMRRVSLDAPAGEWARAVLEAVGSDRPTQEVTLGQVLNSGFNITASVTNLTTTYMQAVDAAVSHTNA